MALGGFTLIIFFKVEGHEKEKKKGRRHSYMDDIKNYNTLQYNGESSEHKESLGQESEKQD